MNFFEKTHLQPQTAKTYNSKLNKWISIMPERKNNLGYIFLNPNYSFVQIRQHLMKTNMDTAQTLHSYTKSIISAGEHNKELFNDIPEEDYKKAVARWKELRQVFHQYANSYRAEQKPSPTQALKGGTNLAFADLTSKRDELPDDSIDKLLLGFYTYVPPVRSDFFATQILDFNETPEYPNYIFHNSEKSYLKITDFKTANLYKSIEYELPSELHRLLTISLKSHPRKFLFQNRFGKCFTRGNFSEWATKRLSALFKTQFTVTLFRHIFISTLDMNSSATYLLDISNKMGHSLTQQILYRWREQPDKIVEVD